RRLVLAVAEHARVDPTAARGRAVALQRLIAGDRLAFAVDAADLGEHGLRARLLVLAGGRVEPGEVEHGPVARLRRVLQLLADPAPEVVVEPEVGAAVLF